MVCTFVITPFCVFHGKTESPDSQLNRDFVCGSGATSTIKVKFQSNRFHLFSCEHTVYQVFSI